MRPLLARNLLITCFAYGLASLPAGAQTQASASDAPPQLEKLEEGQAPAVTIRGSKPQTQITEKREQGKVTSVKVTTGGSTYYLKPNEPAGSALPGDGQSDTTRGAQWKVMEFDLGRHPDAQQTGQAADTVPPPAVPPSKK